MENDGVYNNSFVVRRIPMLDRPGMSMVRVPRLWIDTAEKTSRASIYDEYRSFPVRKEEHDPEAYYVIMSNDMAMSLMSSLRDHKNKKDVEIGGASRYGRGHNDQNKTIIPGGTE